MGNWSFLHPLKWSYWYITYVTLPYTFGPQNHEKMQILNLQHMGYNRYNP